MPTVVALGFDLFFRPRVQAAAQAAGLTLATPAPADAAEAAGEADRVVADASAPGVADALEAIRKKRPDVPIVAAYPHVDEALAARLTALGARAVRRGEFNQRIGEALAGRMDPESS